MSKRIDMINGFPVMVDDEVSGYNSSSTAIETIGLDNSVIHNLTKKHGRLIDEDELKEKLKNFAQGTDIRTTYVTIENIYHWLNQCSTVIEAEDGE